LQQVLQAASDDGRRSTDGTLLATLIKSKTAISFLKLQSISGDRQQRQVATADNDTGLMTTALLHMAAAVTMQQAMVSKRRVAAAAAVKQAVKQQHQEKPW